MKQSKQPAPSVATWTLKPFLGLKPTRAPRGVFMLARRPDIADAEKATLKANKSAADMINILRQLNAWIEDPDVFLFSPHKIKDVRKPKFCRELYKLKCTTIDWKLLCIEFLKNGHVYLVIVIAGRNHEQGPSNEDDMYKRFAELIHSVEFKALYESMP